MIIRIIVLTLHPQKLNKNRKMWDEPTKFCEGWNFGPNPESIASVWDVATKVIENYGSGDLNDLSDHDALHEAKLLMLDISKARYELGWQPKMNISETVALTIDWYKRFNSENVFELCLEHIQKYTEKI